MRETIGILGGSFNPIHLGHLAMAEAAAQSLGLDSLLIMPAGDPPHKSVDLASGGHRLRMARLGCAGRFAVSSMEIDRPGKTYTIDTLRALHALHPGARFHMLAGADTLGEIHGWRDAQAVCALCTFAVFARGNLPLEHPPGARVVRIGAAIPDISSTEIRRRVRRGQSLEGYVHAAVEDYIGLHRLYDPPRRMQELGVQERLKGALSPGRYSHVLGVVKTVGELAARWGYDVETAARAALLHDCAKAMALSEMNAYVDAQGLRIDPGRRASAGLLHAPAGAAMARAVYGETNPDILRAIRYHNTGRAPMGTLDKLLLIADMTEPGRAFEDTDALRALSARDLDAATRACLRGKLAHINSRGQPAHPDTETAIAAMEPAGEREEAT